MDLHKCLHDLAVKVIPKDKKGKGETLSLLTVTGVEVDLIKKAHKMHLRVIELSFILTFGDYMTTHLSESQTACQKEWIKEKKQVEFNS